MNATTQNPLIDEAQTLIRNGKGPAEVAKQLGCPRAFARRVFKRELASIGAEYSASVRIVNGKAIEKSTKPAAQTMSWLIPPRYRVALVRETPQRPIRQVSDFQDIAEIFESYLADADREMVVVMMLDTRNQVIGISTVHVGTLDSSNAEPRDIFKPAILANASAIVLAHNHPSGDTSPSDADRSVTQRVSRVGELLGIPLLDHVIVGEPGKSFSFHAKRLL